MTDTLRVLHRFRDLLSAKLGRCPRCVRWSIQGTLLGWAVTLGLTLTVPNPIAVALAVLVAACFTALMTAHLAAFGVRTFRHLRVCRRARPEPAFEPGRRDLVWAAAKSCAGLAALALFGRLPGFAQVVVDCPGTHKPGSEVTGSGTGKQEAEQDYAENAVAACDALCKSKNCAPGKACVRSGNAVASNPKCNPPAERGGLWTCTGVLKACPCNCLDCAGEHAPIAPYTEAFGAGETREAAETARQTDANGKCSAYCALISADCAPNTCVHDEDKQQATVRSRGCHKNQKTGLFECKGTILKCKCKCSG